MERLSDVLQNLQRRFLGRGEEPTIWGSAFEEMRNRRTEERIQRFQWRLSELDKRLAHLR